jgi:hypothetical protein
MLNGRTANTTTFSRAETRVSTSSILILLSRGFRNSLNPLLHLLDGAALSIYHNLWRQRCTVANGITKAVQVEPRKNGSAVGPRFKKLSRSKPFPLGPDWCSVWGEADRVAGELARQSTYEGNQDLKLS